MLYHGYLTSEAAAYPVFLLAVGVSVRALASSVAAPGPARRSSCSALAVLTRAQFLVLPLVFVLAVFLVGRPSGAMRPLSPPLRGSHGVRDRWQRGARLLPGARGSSTTRSPRRFAGAAGRLPCCHSPLGFSSSPARSSGSGSALVRPRSAAERAICRRHGTADRAAAAAGRPGRVRGGHRPFERYAFYVRAAPLPRVLAHLPSETRCAARFHLAAALGLAAVAARRFPSPPSRSTRSRSTRRRFPPWRRPAVGRRRAMPQRSSRPPG